jgi:predicted NBD/HSP70 family sugar kinase
MLVFDLGGTHLRCGIASAGVVVHVTKQRIQSFLNGLTPEAVSCGIAAQMEAYAASVSQLVTRQDPIVVSFPGPVGKRGAALDAPTLYGNTCNLLPDLAGELRRRTGRDVRILNDVSAATWYLSKKTAATRFLVVTVSSGIGSKIFDRGHPSGVLDDPPFAGEIGHYVVDPNPDALRCDCGGLGHLGGIASGRGVERMARRVRGDANLTNEQHLSRGRRCRR